MPKQRMERKGKKHLSVTQYITETKNQGIQGTPFITLGGDTIAKNDMS